MQSHSERCWVFFFLRELYKTISRNLESRTRRFWAHACGLWEPTLHMMGPLWAEHNELRQVQPKRILEDPTLPLYITWATTDDCRLAIRTCDVVTSTPSSFMRGVYLVSYPSSLICNKRCTLACSRRILWKAEKKLQKHLEHVSSRGCCAPNSQLLYYKYGAQKRAQYCERSWIKNDVSGSARWKKGSSPKAFSVGDPNRGSLFREYPFLGVFIFDYSCLWNHGRYVIKFWSGFYRRSTALTSFAILYLLTIQSIILWRCIMSTCSIHSNGTSTR